MEKVHVYRFFVYDILSNRMLPSSRLATLDTIGQISNAKAIRESRQEVREELVDADGFYGK